MADANAIRKRRHDSCMATTRCSRCQAWPGRECHEVRSPWSGGHVYPSSVMQRAAREFRHAGMSMGKTMVNTAGKFMRSDWGREMGGLHKERWAAWNGRSAVERLGELVDG